MTDKEQMKNKKLKTISELIVGIILLLAIIVAYPIVLWFAISAYDVDTFVFICDGIALLAFTVEFVVALVAVWKTVDEIRPWKRLDKTKYKLKSESDDIDDDQSRVERFGSLQCLQQQLDLKKDYESQLAEHDLSGKMDFCDGCCYKTESGCAISHEERGENRSCAQNYISIELLKSIQEGKINTIEEVVYEQKEI